MNQKFCASRSSFFWLTSLSMVGLAGMIVPAGAQADPPPQPADPIPLPLTLSLNKPTFPKATSPTDENLLPSATFISSTTSEAELPHLEAYLETQPSDAAGDLAPVTPSSDELAQSGSTEDSQPTRVAQTSDTFGQPGLPGVFREAREDIDSPTFSLFNWLAPTSALRGPERRRVVSTSIKTTGLALVGSFVTPLGANTHAGLVVEAGTSILAFDLGFISATEQPRSGFGANIFGQRSHLGTYVNGDNEIDLPNGDTAWIHRLGGGVEYYRPFADNLETAIGVSYQRVSVRDDFFSDNIFAEDDEGNALTVDSDGIDDLLTLNFAATYDTRNNSDLTTSGSLARFGINQGFNLGEEDNAYTQVMGYYTQYIPVNFFGFDEGPQVLILNVQGGIGLGDVPSYEGFNLGGRTSVRGYSGGEISTAASFFQATAEYRFPVAQFRFREDSVRMRGLLFADYATDFGTADQVIGQPAEARDKPGDGFGFGVGLHTTVGNFYNRFELGIADSGDVDVIFTFGDRF
ncbi:MULTISPECIES: BamA/TamA family outer membrane protein [unclassified Leptolyngbya]|uniref:BamA/TamA family outer membrane protein n=1 Tax=unclassified Leptolyngbya TaxID=2650499 RepID=UPI001684778F|nr:MULTISPECIES: BamA/TamA family outer membrane protein [unclassified Leptolyngbya]MBD1912727.1 BamA/TamA family outer membrane protein [Leptolyngbya sp. FACHB-8]MBD2154650.1 BamA/TamA family outer membrane protein [Leptolyngbya sp. FACHB-16]